MLYQRCYADGADLRSLPFTARREILVELGVAGPAWCTVPSYPASDLDVLFEAVTDMGLEGIVLKERESRYVEGRSKWWVKLKTREWSHRHFREAP